MLDDLLAIVQSNDTIMDLLGENLYINRIPFESGLPAMMVQGISSNATNTKDQYRYQDKTSVDFDMFAEKYETLQTLADELRVTFINYNFNYCELIKEVLYDDESDLYEENKNIMMKTVSYSVIF